MKCLLPIILIYRIYYCEAYTASIKRGFAQYSYGRGHERESRIPLSMSWFQNIVPKDKNHMLTSEDKIKIGRTIGYGSYGTVSICQFVKDGEEGKQYIAKRSWSLQELSDKNKNGREEYDDDQRKNVNSQKLLKERWIRCKGYLDIEQKSLEKILKSTNGNSKTKVPELKGRFKDDSKEGFEWIVFETVNSRDGKVAKCLKQLMFQDWMDQKSNQKNNEETHPLSLIQQELGMEESMTFGDTLDRILLGILEVLIPVHESNIVHRDIKPDNILVGGSGQDFVLIDFGSAGDVDEMRKNALSSMFENQIVTLSPIYAAPELYVEWDKNPKSFDVFSTGLVFCQLLFNLLDDRTDAGFRQQLEEADFDLDLWLERELQASLIPAGIEDGLEYLGSRPGIWGLLKKMLQEKPTRRISAAAALKTAKEILAQDEMDISKTTRKETDGSYFHFVIEEMDMCKLPTDLTPEDASSQLDGGFDRQLHFVASFDRSASLGLILAESDVDQNLDDEYEYTEIWSEATKRGKPGDLFIREIVKGGQADLMEIFEIGDRVAGIDQFEFHGFDQFVDILGSMPEKASSVVVHFDRKLRSSGIVNTKEKPDTVAIASHGAWSVTGRRKAQEDSFVLHEFDTTSGKILLSGVFDGHGGDAASKSAARLLPQMLSSDIALYKNDTLTATLEKVWNKVCDSYREGCALLDSSCVADYDASEGALLASTGGEDLVAGTTATIAAICDSELTILNCGDSRTLLVGDPVDEKTWVQFVTRDHKPSDTLEQERLLANPAYSDPQCSMGKFWIKVGDYRYTLSRSLEGSFVTSKGIVSTPDVYKIDLKDVVKNTKSNCILIQASDGLFDVLDNEEVAKDAINFRKAGLDAKECSSQLARLALKKGTSDNVSVVTVYLE